MTLWKVVRHVILALVVIAVLLGGVAFLLLGTERGRAQLIGFALGFTASPDMKIAVEEIESPSLGQLRFGRVTVADSAGTWLDAGDVALDWTPSKLLSGTLEIDRAAAATIAVMRPPVSTAASTGGGFPQLPFGIDLGALAIGRLDLAEAVLGVADALSVEGRARLLSEAGAPLVEGEAHVRRLANETAGLDADWTYRPAADRLMLDLRLSEAANGTLQPLLGLRPELPIDVTVAGDGTLTDWAGRLEARAGEAGGATGDLTLTRTPDGVALSADLRADLGGIFLDPGTSILAGRTDISAEALLLPDGAVRLDRLLVEAPFGSAQARGTLGADRQALSGAFSAVIPDAAPLAPLITGHALGFANLRVEGTVAGTVSAPELRAGADAERVSLDAIAMDRLTARIEPAPEGAPAPLRLTGTASRFRLSAGAEPRDVSFDVAFSLAGGDPVVALAEIGLGGNLLRFTGTAGAAAVDGAVSLTVPDIGALADLTGREGLKGTLGLNANVAGDPATGIFTAALNGTAEALATGIPQVDGLLGAATTLSGTLRTGAEGLTFEDAEIASDNGSRISGSGAVGGGEADRLDLAFALANLAPLDPNLAGAASGTLALSGGFADPTVSLRASMPEGKIGDRQVEDFALSYDGKLGGGLLDGAAELSGTIASIPVAASGHVGGSFAAPTLTDLSLTAASATAAGSLAFGGTGLPSGTISVDAPRIEDLALLFGVAATGALKADITLPGEGAEGPPRIDATVTGLSVAGVKVDELTIAGTSADLGALAFSADVSGRGVAVGGAVLDTVAGTLEGSRSAIAGDLGFTALGGEGTARAAIRFGAGPLAIDLDAFTFDRGGARLALAAPTELTVGEEGIRFDDVALTAGGGSAVVSGTAGAMLDVTAAVTDLPLSLAAIASPGLSLGGTLSGTIEVTGPSNAPAANYDLAVDGLTFAGGEGLVDGLDLAARGSIDSTAVSATGEIAGPDGRSGTFDLAATIADGIASLTSADLDYAGNTARFTGTARTDALDGQLALDIPDLSAFAPLAGRPLAGSVALNANLTGNPSAGTVAAAVNGVADDLSTGVAALDGLLAGRTTIEGTVSAAGDSIDFDDLALTTSTGTRLAANGGLGGATPLELPFRFADLSALSPQLAGAAEGTLTLTGGLGSPDIALDATVAEGSVAGQPVRDLAVTYRGRFAGDALDGDATLAGSVAGVPVEAKARLSGPLAALTLADLQATAASATASGTITLGGALPSGRIRIDAPSLAELARLAGVEASGSLAADIALPEAGSGAAPRIEADIRDLRVAGVAVDRLAVTSRNADPGALAFSAEVDGRGVSIGGTVIDRVTGTLDGTPERLGADLRFGLAGGTVDVAGEVALGAVPLAVTLTALRFERNGEAVTLAAPATIRIADGTASFDRLELASAGGRAVVTGSAGERLDLDATVSGLPLSVASLFAPGLDLSGTVNGTVSLSGTAAAPVGRYDLRVANFSMAELRDASVGNLDISASGQVTPSAVTASGRIGGPAGAAIDFDGSVPLSGGPIGFTVRGGLDLAALDQAFGLFAAEVAGRLELDGRIEGPIAQPGFRGTVTLAGGSYVDRAAGIAFTNIAGSAAADGQRITIRSLTAAGSTGGQVSASGTVDLGAAGGPAADLTITAANARVLESREMTLDVDGRLAVTGPLLRQPLIAGTIVVQRLEVNLANRIPAALQPLDVSHRNAPAGLQTPDTGGGSGGGGGGSGAFDARLDLTLSAPGRVFIRGQGLDAELEGDIGLTGTLRNPVVSGAFHLRRGTFSVLTQRLELTKADLTFIGDTNPVLDIAAETSAGDVTAIFSITGTAAAPDFAISSSPELPEDEVLSRLLFNRATEDLTAGQAIQLAQAIGQLAGATNGPGLIESLRAKTGLDELSFSTDTEGNPVLTAGRYIGDRIYVGVEQGTEAESTRATIDLDLTDTITARGEIGANGSSRIGITIEKDY